MEAVQHGPVGKGRLAMADQNEINELLNQSLAEAKGQVDGMQQDIAAAVGPTAGEQGGIDMLGDVDLDVTIELGRTEMLVEDVLRLASGSVVELDKLAGTVKQFAIRLARFAFEVKRIFVSYEQRLIKVTVKPLEVTPGFGEQ